jgi:isopentenyl diphosphate isomerase/L-lactate dehydrogenase-like FMN-dependent dehydrogenase
MHRRELLRFLAGSPFFMGLPQIPGEKAITSPEEAFSVFDFERVARDVLPPAHWGYLATGVDGDRTLHANREGFDKFSIRARRLVDVREVDTSIEMFGTRWETPIVLAPVGSQKAFHPEGEVAVARAAKNRGHLQILSTMTTSSVEDVNAAHDKPVWYQLYPTASWDVTEGLLKRAERAGCPAVVLTVDLPVISYRETAQRLARMDARDCSVCHESGPIYFRLGRKPMFDNVDVTGLTDLDAPSLTWSFIERLKEHTTMKVLIKGIVTAEDAARAVESGVDGIIVSNHGGRAEASMRSTVECLPEIVDTVRGRIAVLVDSGFRRGTDFFKALAIGADAVCIGRPYLWGLAAFGQAGVEAVLDLLKTELEIVMRQMGTPSIAQITASRIAVKRSR